MTGPRFSDIQKTGEAGGRSCDSWIGNLACYPLYNHRFYFVLKRFWAQEIEVRPEMHEKNTPNQVKTSILGFSGFLSKKYG